MIRIQTNKGQDCAFWLARVGSRAGCPLREPYTANNSFAVISDDPEADFARLLAAFEGGAFKPYMLGSVQPAIRVRDAQRVADKAQGMDMAGVRTVIAAVRSLDAMAAQLAKIEQLKRAAGQAAYYQSKG